MTMSDGSIALALEVQSVCEQSGYELLLIGAMALAAHGYPRSTEDIDFALAIDPRELAKLKDSLESQGFTAELSESDADDPLGGVITITRAGAFPLQLVNFDNSPAGGFPRLVRDAIERSSSPEGGLGKLATAEDLILFKLYAGGPKSIADILELLTRTQVDLSKLRDFAAGYGMSRELERVLSMVELSGHPVQNGD
jgi:hypothetical protein